jgi:hypothetical protein
MDPNATLGSPRYSSPFCEVPRTNTVCSPGWGPLLIASPSSSSQMDMKHFPIPRARRCSSPTVRVSTPTKHDSPASGQGLNSCQTTCQKRNLRGSFSDDVRFSFAYGFGRHLGRLEVQSGEATVRQHGTREPSPTRVPSTKHTKLTHITCRSGTFKLTSTGSEINISSAEREFDSQR